MDALILTAAAVTLLAWSCLRTAIAFDRLSLATRRLTESIELDRVRRAEPLSFVTIRPGTDPDDEGEEDHLWN